MADHEDHADRLACGMMAALGPDDRSCWIAEGTKASDVASGLDADQGPGYLSFFSLPSVQPAVLEALPDELWQVLGRRRSSSRLILLELDAANFSSLTDRTLRQWCRQWRDWLAMHGACLVVVAYGALSQVLRGRLTPFNDVLDGLVHLQPAGSQGRYLIVHWRNGHGAHGTQALKLAPVALGWRLVLLAGPEETGADDEHVCIAQRAVLQGDMASAEHWHVHDSIHELLVEASRARAATVILAVEEDGEVEAVARWIHNLRIQRGHALKLVVRELSPCLRYRDERLLALCGANRVVEHNASSLQFLNQIDEVQGQHFTRHVSLDFEALLASLCPSLIRSAVSPATFIAQVSQWLDGEQASSLMMVALQAAGCLSAEQALQQCRINRQGDLVTVMEDGLYLFLHGCQSADLDMALQRLFGLPASALFASRRIYSEVDEIGAELHRLITLGWDNVTYEIAQDLTSPGTIENVSGAMASSMAVRPPAEPRPVTLKLKDPAVGGSP